MSEGNNKFRMSEVEVASAPSVVALPPDRIELGVDAAQGPRPQ